MPKYALHPGHVISKMDGEEHYIGVYQLARLYELDEGEYIVWKTLAYRYDDYVHLYPRYDGNYGRPE